MQENNIDQLFQFSLDSLKVQSNYYQVNIPSNIHKKKELFDIYVKLLMFPDYFGYNWDAFDECIKNLEWIKEKNIFIVHNDLPFLNDLHNLKIYIDTLAETAIIFKSETDHVLTIIFPKNTREQIWKIRNVLS